MHRIEAYIVLAIILIIIISILYIPVLLKLRKKGINTIRQISYIGAFSSVFLIIFATILFMPINFHPETHTLNINPFNWINNSNSIKQFIVEKIPNIMLFIPLGFFIPVLFKSKRKIYKTILISFIVTFSVEFIQYFIGRQSDIVDIITNLFGSIIGYEFFNVANKVFLQKKWWNKFIGNKKN